MVSVIVPIYNKEKELGRCIDSITNQTYSDLEIILVNDGSTDNSLTICNMYEKTDSRIEVINKENGGVSTARNSGLKKATGEWIMFVDPDDMLLTDCIERLIQGVRDSDVIVSGYYSKDISNSSYDTIISNYITYDRFGYFKDDCFFLNNPTDLRCVGNAKKDLYIRLFNIYNNGTRLVGIGVPWGRLIKASLLISHGIRYDEKLYRMQDYIFNMHVFYHAKCICYLNEPLYIYNSSHLGTISTQYDERSINYYASVLEQSYNFMVSTKMIIDDDIYNAYCVGVVDICNNLIKKYYLNAPATERKKAVLKLKDFFDNKKYRDAVFNKKRENTKIIRELRVKKAMEGKYDYILVIEYIVRFIKLLKSRVMQ